MIVVFRQAAQRPHRSESLRRLELVLTVLGALFWGACAPANQISEKPANRSAQTTEPVIEVAPSSKSDQWQVLSSDTATFTVTAPNAQAVKILYRPAFVEGRHTELKNLNAPSDREAGRFTAQLKVPSDFAGDVWAEVSYPKGEKKETKPIPVTVESISPGELADASYKHSDESARSDKITGGTIEKTELERGNGDIRITVNIPAFQLTLWQGGKEVKTYPIGIGRREFPLPSGLRRANQIVYNPDWVPPDSSWVEDHDVEPGERVEADDPRNPLGKLKIPLGNGILIHQASGPRDLGHLVSHGCVRLLLNDLYDLSEKIIAARSANVSPEQIEHAKASKDRLMVKLDTPVNVDISYDTQVVEGGVLRLYPDVYDQKTNTPENVRAELQDVHVAPDSLDDGKLRQMLARVTMTEAFTVTVSDIKAGHLPEAGKNEPVIPVAATPQKQPRPGNKSRR